MNHDPVDIDDYRARAQVFPDAPTRWSTTRPETGTPRPIWIRYSCAAADGFDAALANWLNASSAWLAYMTEGPAPI